MQKKTTLLIGIPNLTLTQEDENRLRSIKPKGIILFVRNYKSSEQMIELTKRIRSILGEDTIIAVDHEGGRVVRFSAGLPHLPAPHTLGAQRDSEKVYRLSREAATALQNLGITLNLAPVVDIPNLHSPMRDRCFGNEPELVAEMSLAFVSGMHDGGIKCTAKHFPGLGNAIQDTHERNAIIALSRDELELHWIPFRMLIKAGIDAILISHAIYSELDGINPATFSRKIIKDILRKELNFSGLVISDDLEMGAISEHYSIEAAVTSCINAGCDLASVCHDTNHDLEGILTELG